MTNLVPLTSDEEKLVAEVLKNYPLPSIRQVSRNTIGYVNKTFVIETTERKFVLRESARVTDPEHLELEVEVLRFLESKHYPLAARVFPNMHNEYLTKHAGNSYMLQTFLSGMIQANVNNVANFDGDMLRNLFRATAEFAKTTRTFRASRNYKNEPLYNYVKNADQLLSNVIESLPKSAGRSLLEKHKSELLAFASQIEKEMQSLGYDKFPKQLVHFDIHPGNVHYEGNKVVGMFDFDWIRFDSRFSDLASAIVQSCHVWGGPTDGVLIKEKISRGFSAYREAFGTSEFSYEEEKRIARSAAKAFMFFQVLWAADWYRDNPAHHEAMEVLPHWINSCLINNYDSLFS